MRQIYKKYEAMPNAVTTQVMNRQIKTICEPSKINQPIMLEGKTWIKYQMASTHTARSSVATNVVKAGTYSEHIMSITGHSTSQSFAKYIKLTVEEHAELTAKNPFLTGIDVVK